MKKGINSIFPTSLMPDFSDSVIYFRQTKNHQSTILRYYQLTERFQNQLNGYRYCWNNPLKYTDPTGNALDPITHTAIGLLLSALYTELLCNFEHVRVAYEFWRDWLLNQLEMDDTYYIDWGMPMLQ